MSYTANVYKDGMFHEVTLEGPSPIGQGSEKRVIRIALDRIAGGDFLPVVMPDGLPFEEAAAIAFWALEGAMSPTQISEGKYVREVVELQLADVKKFWSKASPLADIAAKIIRLTVAAKLREARISPLGLMLSSRVRASDAIRALAFLRETNVIADAEPGEVDLHAPVKLVAHWSAALEMADQLNHLANTL